MTHKTECKEDMLKKDLTDIWLLPYHCELHPTEFVSSKLHCEYITGYFINICYNQHSWSISISTFV
jgi:hypothetical protein